MTARDITRPEPCFVALRLVKNGPEVPACIQWVQTRAEPGNFVNLMDRSGFLCAYIAGELVSPYQVWERRGRPITEADYKFLLSDMRWASRHAVHEPIANPKQPVDLTKLPAIMP